MKYFAFDFEKKPTTRTRGQAIVEFALLLPFLLALIGGVIDFGLSIFAGHIAQNAAREGARQGAVIPPSASGTPIFPSGEEGSCTVFVDCSGKVLGKADSVFPSSNLFNGFTITSAFIPGPLGESEDGVRVTVGGTYDWFLLDLIGAPLPLLGFSGFPSSIAITRSATMRWEWQ